MTQQTPIQRYAALKAAVLHNRAHKHPVPPQWMQEIQEIELWATVNLPPDVVAAASRMVDQQVLRIMEGQRISQEEWHQQAAAEKADRVARSLSEGQFSVYQTHDIARGGKLPAGPKGETPQERDLRFREATKLIDPSGRGWGEKEHVRRMDELSEATPEKFRQLASRYSASPQTLKKIVGAWDEHRISFGLDQRRRARAEHEEKYGSPKLPERTEPTDRERRRAQIASTYLEKSADAIEEYSARGQSVDIERHADGVSPDIYNERTSEGNPSRRAVIASALDAQERYGDNHEQV